MATPTLVDVSRASPLSLFEQPATSFHIRSLKGELTQQTTRIALTLYPESLVRYQIM